jgi:hypothetical protein
MGYTTIPNEHDTLTHDTSTNDAVNAPEATPTRKPVPPPRSHRAVLSWMAVGIAVATSIALVVTVLVSGGDSDDRPAVTPADVAGSDEHLANQANDIAGRSSLDVTGSDQHLANQADDIADRSLDVTGSDQHLANQANDIADRSLDVTGSDQHLANQANDIADRAE